MAVEVSQDEAERRFKPPPAKVEAPKLRPSAEPDHALALKAQAGRIAELEGRVNELNEVMMGMAEAEIEPRPPVLAEVFYDADGRVKSLRMGRFGAVATRDGDGRLRTINIQELT